MVREGKNLEFKENVNSKTFLKTVSAYANYNGGTIVFGVDDDGNVIGLSNAVDDCLNIENTINDNISPKPDFSLDIKDDGTVRLEVFSGIHKPYFYKSKAYKRNDTATIEMDNAELKRIILEGQNLSFEDMKAENQKLKFGVLEAKLKDKVGIKTFSIDTLKTLGLYSDADGYNNAGEILADENNFCGVDIARFGETISIILKRLTLEKMSVLSMYDKSLELFCDNYEYEEIKGFERAKIERIPEEAFREAIANALIHRDWGIQANIKISMFDDKVEIVSPGSLPSGVSEEDYLKGNLSKLRNPLIADIFFRLHFVERFGTGILRIKDSYAESVTKPEFIISDTTIKIVLPVLKSELKLTGDEQEIYDVLSKHISKSISEIIEKTSFSRSKVRGVLNELVDRNIVEVEGRQRGTKYKLK